MWPKLFKFNNPKNLKAFDLHLHSTASADSYNLPSLIIRRAKKLNIGVAICDHNEIQGAIKIYQKAGQDILVIPGIEIKTAEGAHLLFYFENIDELEKFYSDLIFPRKTPYFYVRVPALWLIQAAKKYSCLVGLPHPYLFREGGSMKLVNKGVILEKDLIQLADFIETKNTFISRALNVKAAALAKQYQKSVTGGSDGHLPHQIGQGLTLMKANSARQALEVIARGQTEVIGREASWFERKILRIPRESRLILRKNGLKIIREQIKKI